MTFTCVVAQVNQDENISKLAEHYFSEKNFSQALPLFEELHRKNPTTDFFFDRHWACLYELGRYKDAHDVLDAKFKVTRDLGLLDDMARISILAGEPARAEKEWKSLLEGFNYNPNIVRSVGITMSGLRRYDLAKALFLSQRSPADPYAFNQEMIHIYTQTVDAQGAATEFLLLLKQRPEQDGLVESRITQYFSDSLLSAKMLSIFDKADSVTLPPSILRIKGTLAKQSFQFDKAFSSTSRYDELLKNGGSTSFYLINSLSMQENRDEIIRLAERFAVRFPLSQFRGQIDLKLGSVYAETVWLHPENLNKIETVYKRQNNERDQGLLRDVYLKAVLKSPDNLTSKKERIEKILAGSRVSSRQYWDWVLAVLDGDFQKAQKLSAGQGFKTSFKWEFILNALASNVPVDSLRQTLFSFSRDLKSTDTPKYLYLLIQSVPVPSVDFVEFAGVAKGLIYQQLGLIVQASDQFTRVAEQTKDFEIQNIARNERLLILIEMGNENEILKLTGDIASSPGVISKLDESVFKSALFFYNRGNLIKARELFELIVKDAPVSAYTSMAREYLNEIRKRNS